MKLFTDIFQGISSQKHQKILCKTENFLWIILPVNHVKLHCTERLPSVLLLCFLHLI